ncbi:PREDICTED: uncharacterized protein LOC109211443 [Nicotiana attenuata]|uniref:uncharacterized protein LOC109211443 n=1 Tax=Nicotiana attenuata TaxID=49451 RepID=UPI0009052057|nr:PREDICTED: uncharacterized protein LOC109211443 [Nicotiana attenuata]
MECVQTVNYSIVVNGEPTKPFNAAKGLRQGDPMSAYLFAIAMEYLCRNLASLKKEKEFKYHPRCLVKPQKRPDEERLGVAGLQANLRKSEAYFGGVPVAERQQILQMLGLANSELPFKYLGVPVSTKKLSLMQWQPLIDKMIKRITSWAAKTLSYAGRVQLVQSVLFGIQAFWEKLFILPTKVIKLVKRICRSYVWSGANEITKKALITWDKKDGMEAIDVSQCSKTKGKVYSVAHGTGKIDDMQQASKLED